MSFSTCQGTHRRWHNTQEPLQAAPDASGYRLAPKDYCLRHGSGSIAKSGAFPGKTDLPSHLLPETTRSQTGHGRPSVQQHFPLVESAARRFPECCRPNVARRPGRLARVSYARARGRRDGTKCPRRRRRDDPTLGILLPRSAKTARGAIHHRELRRSDWRRLIAQLALDLPGASPHSAWNPSRCHIKIKSKYFRKLLEAERPHCHRETLQRTMYTNSGCLVDILQHVLVCFIKRFGNFLKNTSQTWQEKWHRVSSWQNTHQNLR